MALFRKAYVDVTAQTDVIVISHEVKRIVLESGLKEGVVNVFVPVGTSGVTLLENDPKIYENYQKCLEDQIPSIEEKRPQRKSGTGHTFAHLRAAWVGHSVQIPIAEGKLQTGPWQEILLFDFDDKVGRREYFIFVMGEAAK